MSTRSSSRLTALACCVLTAAAVLATASGCGGASSPAAAAEWLANNRAIMMTERGSSVAALTISEATLSADGKLFTCLFATQGHDLRELLRTGVTDDVIASRIAGIWQVREDHYSEIRTAATPGLKKIEMSYIGG